MREKDILLHFYKLLPEKDLRKTNGNRLTFPKNAIYSHEEI